MASMEIPVKIEFSEESKKDFIEVGNSIDRLVRKLETKSTNKIERFFDTISNFGLKLFGIFVTVVFVVTAFLDLKKFIINAWIGFHR